ncbi:MAG: NTP/NDP exchange transporter [Woeseia sp.]
MQERATQNSVIGRVARFLGLRRGELVAVAWSFVYFFSLLSAYYMLRSIREAMAIVSGVQNIPWLFTGTFFGMMLATVVFGWVTSRYSRKQFLPWIYYFFILNILIFFAAFTYTQRNDLEMVWIARAFFVWLSVFNYFVVSVFWSFMADIYTKEQGRRLFGIISAGGSAGAILGPLMTGALVIPLGFQNLLPLSAFLLMFSIYCVAQLRRWAEQESAETHEAPLDASKPIGGGALAGIRQVATSPFLAAIAVGGAFASLMGTAIYIYMAQLVGENFATTDEQTRVFALLDASTNVLSLIGQLIIVKQVVQRFGIGVSLAILPIVSVIGFAILAANPVFIVIAALQVARRSLAFGLAKPTSDMLYTVVSPEEKYKAKNFVETALYRGGDLVGSWVVRMMGGLGLGGISLVCVPLAAIWTAIAFWLGKDYRRRDRAISEGLAV